MAEGTLYIRIGLPPRVVSGDHLVLSCYGLTARNLHCRRAYLMSRDWGCISTVCCSVICLCGPGGYTYDHMYVHFRGSLYPMMDCTLRV